MFGIGTMLVVMWDKVVYLAISAFKVIKTRIYGKLT